MSDLSEIVVTSSTFSFFIEGERERKMGEGGVGGERERQTERLLHSFIYLPFLLVLCYCDHCNLM